MDTNNEFTPEEIAKSLRVCADLEKSCGECHMHSKRGCDKDARIAGAEVIEAQAKRILELEAELAQLREEKRWTPVSDAPKDAGPYLVNIHIANEGEPCDFVMDAWYQPDDPILFSTKPIGWNLSEELRNCITHWTKKPEIPKEDA